MPLADQQIKQTSAICTVRSPNHLGPVNRIFIAQVLKKKRSLRPNLKASLIGPPTAGCCHTNPPAANRCRRFRSKRRVI
jgi:hypothetical protein